MKKSGSWIFLSHSSKDIDKVRIIRNVFEAYGQNPLAFHLRCLNTDTIEGREELDSLIKREIDAREWFVFCESASASKSQYVKMEKDYIIKQGKKKVWSIDMSLPINEIKKMIAKICKDISVFISYPPKYKSCAELLIKELNKRDYFVSTSDDRLSDEDNNDIRKTAENGFFVSFYSKDYISDSNCQYELNEAVKNNSRIIILNFDESFAPKNLGDYHYYKIPHIPTSEDMVLIADLIDATLRRFIKGPIDKAEAFNALNKIHEKLNYENRYHAQEAICVGTTGPLDDYCEIYQFPCCGKYVIVGDGPISRYRCDGCKK